MLKKVVSGGQAGVDLAGLLAAKKAGIETGGWMPKDWLTEDGPKPEYADLFGMVEHQSSYKGRTWANVRDSDGTIRFARNFRSAGEICTLNAIRNYKKPWIDVDLRFSDSVTPEEVVEWIKENKIEILNVAGNRETTAPGICKEVQDFLAKVFELWTK